MKKADNLQTRRKTDIGYGRGEYTVPFDDIEKFLGPKSRKQKKEDPRKKLQLLDNERKELIFEFKELKKLFEAYKDKPKTAAKIIERMKKIRDRAQLIDIEKSKLQGGSISERLSKVVANLNKIAQEDDLNKLREQYKRELNQLDKIRNNADKWLNKAIDAKVTYRDKEFIKHHKENKTPEAIVAKKEEYTKAYQMWQKIQEQVLLAESRIEKIKENLDNLLAA